MQHRNSTLFISWFVALSVGLSGCGARATERPAPSRQPVPTTAPVPTQIPPTTRHGGWLDEIDVSVASAGSALSELQAGTIDLYSFSLASNQLDAMRAAGLSYSRSYGGNYAFLFNPAPFSDTTRLNPFSNHKIREAMNWAVDRDFINREIYGGGSLPKYLAITTNLVDYTSILDTARELEARYAFNLETARGIVASEMTGMGAQRGADGKWQFNGQPVSLVFLIRNDGDGTCRPLGDYFTGQLEALGFTVERRYASADEASAVWIGTDPAAGQWNIYTAGWLSPGLTRDEKDAFQQMYAPNSIQSLGVFAANAQIDPEFQRVADALAETRFSSLAERADLMRSALKLSLQDSLQVWVVDQLSYAPFAANVQVTSDLGSGIEASAMNPYNLRFTDREGGALRVGTYGLFTGPWNTVAGSSDISDTAVMRATQNGSSYSAQGGLMGDPYTGLAWPQRIASAELTVQTGLPIAKTLDWVSLQTADEIAVPPDAWVDWDAASQKFITAAEKYPEGTTAKVKSVVTYPDDLFQTVKWHDGSPLSAADFIMPTIVLFDRAKEASSIYDASAVPNVESVLRTYKGFRIASTQPLTIEAYSDLYYGDAELDVVTGWPTSPTALPGENSWDILAISNLAEADGKLAYSADKAEAQQVPQTSWIGGPGLDILAQYLDQAADESLIPYAPTLGQFITADEARSRYDNLKKWYADHAHFWVGTGPYLLDQVSITEARARLLNNPDFPDLADRWSSFNSPRLASVVINGPDEIRVGEQAGFDISVRLPDGAVYANSDMAEVKYLLYDASNSVVFAGTATAVSDGEYTANLGAEVTSRLSAGAHEIEVAAVPIPVAVPAYASREFTVAP
jgi:peptide/nickel transport system substrate-binding protein